MTARPSRHAGPTCAARMHAAGYRAVLAHPMRWHGEAVGALNFFHRKAHLAAEDVTLGQAFADIATLVLVTPSELGMPEIPPGPRTPSRDERSSNKPREFSPTRTRSRSRTPTGRCWGLPEPKAPASRKPRPRSSATPTGAEHHRRQPRQGLPPALEHPHGNTFRPWSLGLRFPRAARARLAGRCAWALATRVSESGAEGIRTPDLLIANETRYQLRHSPRCA